ncbi:hypothetical protein CO641_12045 [Lysobacteraceae bacterium NML91-0213]|nr:hypothetical protein CO641_12045 [Xanthomonadaceae bacterium NML91-0213]
MPATYLASAVASIFVEQDDIPRIFIHNDASELYLTYTALIIVSLLPSLMMRGVRIRPAQLLVQRDIKILMTFASIGAWYSVLYQLRYALQALTLGAASVRDALNVDGEYLLPDSPLTTLAVGISSFYLVYIFLFFTAVANKMGRWLVASMLVGSVSYTVSSLAFAARDGLVFLLLATVFAYPFFTDDLSRAQRRIVKALGGACIIASAFLLASLTLDRFGAGSSWSVSSGTLGYLGQQPFVFVETIRAQVDFYGLSLRFPVIANLFGGSGDVQRTEVFEWSFGTFLKDYYSMYGWPSLVGLALAGGLVFAALFRKRSGIPPVTLLLVVILYFQLMTAGVFYFRLGTRGGNLYLVAYFFLIAISYFRYRSPGRNV